MRCNGARLAEHDGQWRVVGDPTEAARPVLGHESGSTPHATATEWPRVDAIPSESQHRFMATAHRDGDAQAWTFVKGGPGQWLDVCARELGPDGERALDVDNGRRRATALAARGLRLPAPAGARPAFPDVVQGCTMPAPPGIADPPRDEAVRAVAQCPPQTARTMAVSATVVAETEKAVTRRRPLARCGVHA